MSYIRIFFKFIVYCYVIDMIEYVCYIFSDGYLMMLNGIFVWGFYIVFDGVWNFIRFKDKGVLFVDMGMIQVKMQCIEEEFQVGLGMQFFDNLNWVFYKKYYFVDLDFLRVLYYNGKFYIVVFYIFYDFKVFYMVLKWGGVFIVDEDGNVEDLSFEEVIKDECFKDFFIFFENFVRDVVEVQNYWKDSVFVNIKNFWFYYENQIEFIDVSNQGNRQFFLVVVIDGGKYWMMVVEFYGKVYGLVVIYFMNVCMGEMSQVKFEIFLMGLVKVIDYVKKVFLIFDWSQFMVVELIFVFIDGMFWWCVVIILWSGLGVVKIVFVNVEIKEVKIFEDEREVKEFFFWGEVVQVEEIIGEVKVFYLYIKDGNIYWIFVVGNRMFYISVVDLSEEFIFKLLFIKQGDNVMVVISEGRIVDIKC